MLQPKQSRNYVTGLAAACSLLLIACSPEEVRQVNLIPKPEQMTMTGGTFTVDSLALFGGQSSRNIKTVIDEAWSGNPEGYQLDVTPGGIDLRAGSPDGLFYGMQTLRQLYAGGEVPCVSIRDNPRFGYRGLHLDVSRHFFSKEEVMKLLDVMSFYKLNTLHMHLTDAGGWRIEIDKYPKLTSETAFRTESDWRKWWDGRDRKYLPEGTPGAYGGYYTKEDIREIVKHAASKHINIIPEIEFPGHSEEVLMAYPELSCSGKPYQNGDFCIGNEQSFTFMEDVLAEVIDLFPSEYIHVGGDECPKVRWEKCPKCQARIKAEGIKGDKKHSAEEYLQSYVISRMEKFVESKGRHIIGWDEILEGGLAPNATVMSWRGMDGGIEAAKQKHNVVMTPNTYVYLDYYQSADTDLEPEAIGGYLPLEKVYSFEPTAGISPEDQKYVIGAQANLWTEYIPTFSQVEYMIMPRIDAVADIQWSDPSKKDYQTFLPRVARMTQLYDRLGYNYGKHIFDINASLTTNTENGTLDIALTKLGEGDIYYTVDGSDPTIASIKYEGPVQINQDCEFKAIVVRPNGTSRIFSEDIFFNKATMKPITLKEQPSKGYVFNGAQVLVDGLRGGSNYKTGHWLGFQGKDLDATIDLKEPTEIQKVSFNTNVVKGDWIMGASAVTVKVSDDGKNFKEVASKKIPELTQNDKDGLYPQEISFAPVKARYVEVIINSSKLPKWHGGAGSPAFLFVDEIEIL